MAAQVPTAVAAPLQEIQSHPWYLEGLNSAGEWPLGWWEKVLDSWRGLSAQSSRQSGLAAKATASQALAPSPAQNKTTTVAHLAALSFNDTIVRESLATQPSPKVLAEVRQCWQVALPAGTDEWQACCSRFLQSKRATSQC